MRFVLLLLLALALRSTLADSAAADTTGIPCEYFSCWTEGTPTVVLASPAGSAPTVAEQGLVIHLEILDCTLTPIANFPFQDIWLGDTGTGELSYCPGGTIADANTDAEGRTTITGHLSAGGHTETGTCVWVAGILALEMGPLALDVVSPDLDGDLDVDIVDFSLFGQDFGGGSAPRSDLVPDGILNLADFAAFGRHFGEHCP
jgi:hypothetical protein